ncbi:MAG TPA: ATP-binding cassette domain-containing protein, partial [Bellilinea sp.]|nr:ATP-binding cassette domain-containing protein [Bellilinea sp.]
MLEIEGLDAFYGATQILFGVTLAVEKGSITAILGSNGAGKTTTLRAICRMISTQGDIRFGGVSINRKATEQVARMGIAHVPDGRGTFGPLTVEENLRLGAYGRCDKAEVAYDLEHAYARFPRLKERRNQ